MCLFLQGPSEHKRLKKSLINRWNPDCRTRREGRAEKYEPCWNGRLQLASVAGWRFMVRVETRHWLTASNWTLTSGVNVEWFHQLLGGGVQHNWKKKIVHTHVFGGKTRDQKCAKKCASKQRDAAEDSLFSLALLQHLLICSLPCSAPKIFPQ